MADVSQQMMELAESLAETRSDLDFSLGSLKVLEEVVSGRPIAEETTRSWGAYLGETMRRQNADLVRWTDFDSAAGESAAIGALERGYDVEAVLQVGDAFWFPLAKVEKFQQNGGLDSLVAFAWVALSALPRDPAEERERERAQLAEGDARVDEVFAQLRADPTAETLAQAARTFTTYTRRPRYGESLRRLGLSVEELERFLAEAPRGRGWHRINPSRDAAFLIAMLVHEGIAPREATLAELRRRLGDRSKVVRAAAAEALAYTDACALRTGVIVELAQHRNRAVADGAWHALATLAAHVRSEHLIPMGTDALAIEPLVPVILAGLTPASPRRTLALETLANWAFAWKRRRDLAPFTAALEALLDDPKKRNADLAARLLASYLWGIVHGHAPRDLRVEALEARGAPFAEPVARIRGQAPSE